MSISAGVIDIGVDSTRFTPGDPDALLRSYLMMVRRTRNQQRAVSITLRRDDIEVIAEYLEQAATAVLERLADLMGSTRTQRAAMLTLFTAGAMLIAVTGSVAIEAPPSVLGDRLDAEPPVAMAVVQPTLADAPAMIVPTTSATRSTAISSRATDEMGPSRSGADRVDHATTDAVTATAVAATAIAAVTTAVAAGETAEATTARVRPVATTEPSTLASQVESDIDQTAAIVVVDGVSSLVAVGTPPVPQVADTIEAPPAEGGEGTETGLADDGSTVAVGSPPIPAVAPAGDGSTADSTG